MTLIRAITQKLNVLRPRPHVVGSSTARGSALDALGAERTVYLHRRNGGTSTSTSTTAKMAPTAPTSTPESEPRPAAAVAAPAHPPRRVHYPAPIASGSRISLAPIRAGVGRTRSVQVMLDEEDWTIVAPPTPSSDANTGPVAAVVATTSPSASTSAAPPTPRRARTDIPAAQPVRQQQQQQQHVPTRPPAPVPPPPAPEPVRRDSGESIASVLAEFPMPPPLRLDAPKTRLPPPSVLPLKTTGYHAVLHAHFPPPVQRNF